MTNVESQPSLSGNDVGRSGLRLDFAHRGHQPRNFVRLPLDRGDPLCRAGNRIVAKMHRRRTRVVGAAQKCELQPALAGDGIHHSQRPLQCLQNRALLDVEFHVAQNIVSQRSLGISPGFKPKSSMALRTEIPCASWRLRSSSSSLPDQRPAADKWRAKTNSFLLGKANNFNSERKPSSIQSLAAMQRQAPRRERRRRLRRWEPYRDASPAAVAARSILLRRIERAQISGGINSHLRSERGRSTR